VATERTPRDNHIEQDIHAPHRRAVSEARRIRGSVNLEPADARRWSAIVSAVDGSLELRVAEPPRRRPWQKHTWLEAHGFTRAHDCWVLPLAASVSDDDAAARWVEALAGAHGLAAEDVRVAYVGAGVPAVPASAPHAEHVEAALAAIVSGEFNRLHIFGGRPSAPWAFVSDVVGEPGLRIERPHRDDPDNEIDTWHLPRTPEDCRAGAARLVADIEGDWPDAQRLPLFLHLLTPRG
jgi:hypothetical protein